MPYLQPSRRRRSRQTSCFLPSLYLVVDQKYVMRQQYQEQN
jgi:hypothetical protein